LFEYYESTPSARSEIIASAKRRGQQRQQVANFRRAQSMMERFGDSRWGAGQTHLVNKNAWFSIKFSFFALDAIYWDSIPW